MREIKKDSMRKQRNRAVMKQGKESKKNVEWKKWVLLLFIMLCMVNGVETVSNYNAWKYRDDSLEVPMEQKTEKGRLVVESHFSEPHYVGKLRLLGVFQEEQEYTVEYQYVNGFEKTETKKLKDNAYPYYSEAWSPINEKLESVKITFPDFEKVQISQLQVVTCPAINGYRCFFVALITGLTGYIFLYKTKIRKNLHWFLVIYVVGFGILINVSAGPKYTTWDEPVHFRNIYTLSYGKNIEWNEASRMLYDGGLPKVNTTEELRLMKAYMDQQSEISNGSEENWNTFWKRDQFIYVTMAAMLKLGRAMGLTFSNSFLLGRMGNLLLYAVLGCVAIWLCQKRKIVAAAVLMFPTSVFQASTYTYDGIIVAMVALAVVLMMNEAEKGSQKYNWIRITTAVMLILLTSLIKPVYLPLLLLLLIFKKRSDKKRTILLVSLVVIIVILILSIFFLPLIHAAINGNVMYGADVRGGETGVIAQMLSMLSHPFESTRMMIQQMFTMDNFRNLALKGMDDYLPTNLMLLNFANLGCIKDEWSLLLIPLLLLIFLVAPEKWNHSNTRRIKWITGLSVVLSVIAVWGAMYLFFTPVGASSIGGVQVRYFIPLLLPAGYFFWNNRIQVHIKEVTYNKIVLSGILLLMGECIWQLIIMNRCI